MTASLSPPFPPQAMEQWQQQQREWMHANRPTAALWAPCCGNEGRRLALLLGLQVVEHSGAAWAAWLPELAR